MKTNQLYIEELCSQFIRYGDVYCDEITEILEILTDINDDLWHSRHSSLTLANIDRIKPLLDTLYDKSNT